MSEFHSITSSNQARELRPDAVVLLDPSTGQALGDLGNPVHVYATARACVGQQTLSVTTAAVVTLTVPDMAVAALIQADGNAISITLNGVTAPEANVGMRIDDGVIFYVDTSLAAVKMIARTVTTNVQVTYFDKT